MRICAASCWFLSMSILTMRTAPLASFTTFSRAGPSCLQGPHQGAQKSTITGTWREASITSAAKVSSEPSLTTAPGAALSGTAFAVPCAKGLPLGPINAISSHFTGYRARTWAQSSGKKRGQWLNHLLRGDGRAGNTRLDIGIVLDLLEPLARGGSFLLLVPHGGVVVPHGQQFGMPPTLDDHAMVQHQDFICVDDGRQSVRDHKCRAV